jgi:hypothetical protein
MSIDCKQVSNLSLTFWLDNFQLQHAKRIGSKMFSIGRRNFYGEGATYFVGKELHELTRDDFRSRTTDGDFIYHLLHLPAPTKQSSVDIPPSKKRELVVLNCRRTHACTSKNFYKQYS